MKQPGSSSPVISERVIHADALTGDVLSDHVLRATAVTHSAVLKSAVSQSVDTEDGVRSERVRSPAGRSDRALSNSDGCSTGLDSRSLNHAGSPNRDLAHRETQSVLIVSPMADAMNFSATLGLALGCVVHVASSHRAGVIALRHRDYAVVVVDDCLAEANGEAVDLLWQSFGAAIPVRVNFAFSGESRLAREVQAAIVRWEQQRVLALRAAVTQLSNELKSTVTGLLLQSQLALAEPELTAKLTGKLTLVAELAGSLRQRLEGSAAGRGSSALQ